MDKNVIVTLARAVAVDSAATGRPILHATVRMLAFFAGGDRSVIDDAMSDAFAEIAAERRQAHPAFWEA